MQKSGTRNSGESSHVDPGSAKTGSTGVVQFLHQNPEIPFLREVPTVRESSTSGLPPPYSQAARGDSAANAPSGISDMGPPQSRMKGGPGPVRDNFSASRTFPAGPAVAPASTSGVSDGVYDNSPAHSASYYGGSGVKPDSPGLASPGRGATVERIDTSKLVPESMKMKSLKSLQEEPLKVFREVFRYHLKAGDHCVDWHM